MVDGENSYNSEGDEGGVRKGKTEEFLDIAPLSLISSADIISRRLFISASAVP